MKNKLFLIGLLATLASHNSLADDAMLTEARNVAQQLPPKLKTLLEQEIADKGHVGAISVCRDKAPEAAKKHAAETGWKIKRVSLLARNDQRATPDEWEKQTLAKFDADAAAGQDPSKLEASTIENNEYRYMKALPVQPLCLSCHGKEEISDEVRSALKQNYPNDHATGYSVGQIRGAISIRKPLNN